MLAPSRRTRTSKQRATAHLGLEEPGEAGVVTRQRRKHQARVALFVGRLHLRALLQQLLHALEAPHLGRPAERGASVISVRRVHRGAGREEAAHAPSGAVRRRLDERRLADLVALLERAAAAARHNAVLGAQRARRLPRRGRVGAGLAQPRLQAVDHVPVRGPQRERGIQCILKAALLQPRLVQLEHSRDKAHGLEHLADGRAELRVVVEPGGVAPRQKRLHRVVLA